MNRRDMLKCMGLGAAALGLNLKGQEAAAKPAPKKALLAAQMYTVRKYTQTPKDIAESCRRVKAMGYDGIQISGFGPIDRKEMKAILDGVLHDLEKVEDSTGLRVHILQADCRSDAEIIRDGIRAAYPQVGEITITGLGVVIGAHCGPGLLTVFYLCNGRAPE